MSKSKFGIVGFGVMGKGLALNAHSKGICVSVYNRTGEEANDPEKFLAKNKELLLISGFSELLPFIESLEKPRKLLLMVKAGDVVDSVITELVNYLDNDDIIIDGGNSHFRDTLRRQDELKVKGIHFIGCGISGGYEGAKNGASFMPGGDKNAVDQIASILNKLAAVDKNGIPCSGYVGKGASGHFVKMVHNGIEYAEMQLLAELYHLLSISHANNVISEIFEQWNETDLQSFLLEISAKILIKEGENGFLLDKILDVAKSKGTGSWASVYGIENGVNNDMIVASVLARSVSELKDDRRGFSKKISNQSSLQNIDVEQLRNAYEFARLINHHQGFELIRSFSAENNNGINLSELARIWTNGCIIRSGLMEDCMGYFQRKNSLLEIEDVFDRLKDHEKNMTLVLKTGIDKRIPLPCFSSAHNFWISITTENLPANLIQAQRDYFGWHGYKRKDSDLNTDFHTNW